MDACFKEENSEISSTNKNVSMLVHDAVTAPPKEGRQSINRGLWLTFKEFRYAARRPAIPFQGDKIVFGNSLK